MSAIAERDAQIVKALRDSAPYSPGWNESAADFVEQWAKENRDACDEPPTDRLRRVSEATGWPLTTITVCAVCDLQDCECDA